jgi:hypothetical protein
MNGRSEPTFDKPVIRPRDRFFTKGNTSPVIKRDLFDQNIFFGQANNQKRVPFLPLRLLSSTAALRRDCA